MHRKNWESIVIPILILAWLFGWLSLIPDVPPHSVAAGEKKTYLVAVVPQFPPLEIKRDWTKTPVFPSPNAFAASLYLGALFHDIVHKYNGETAITSEAVNGTAFTVKIPVTAIAAGEAPSWP
jgi:hypothetical protein